MVLSSSQPRLRPPPALDALHRWVAGAAGEAYLTGPLVRQMLRGEAGRGVRRAVLLVPAVGTGWAAALRAELPAVEVEAEGGALRLLLGDEREDGASPVEVGIEAYRSPSADLVARARVPLGGILGDLATREITLHAFALDPDGEVIDPFGGVPDLADHTVRPITDPSQVFRERPDHLLRIARYVGYYGWQPDADTTRYALRDAANILSVGREVWLREIDRVLLTYHAGVALNWLHAVRTLSFLLPEVASLVDFHESCTVHHKDCWDHTLKVIGKASRDLITRWTALCHDIGKVWTRTVDRRGQVHFYRHEEFGAVLFEGIAARFRMDPERAARIEAVIRLHGRVNLYESDWTDSAVRRLIRDVEPHLDDLVRFSRADFTSKRPSRVAQIRRQLDDLDRRIHEIQKKDRRRPPLPKGLGNALMNDLGLPAGPLLGKIRRGLEALCAEGEVEPHREIGYYVDAVRRLGQEAVAGAAPNRASA